MESLVVTYELLVALCGIQFPDQGPNPGPPHWEHRVPATEPPGKSPVNFLKSLLNSGFQ